MLDTHSEPGEGISNRVRTPTHVTPRGVTQDQSSVRRMGMAVRRENTGVYQYQSGRGAQLGAHALLQVCEQLLRERAHAWGTTFRATRVTGDAPRVHGLRLHARCMESTRARFAVPLGPRQ